MIKFNHIDIANNTMPKWLSKVLICKPGELVQGCLLLRLKPAEHYFFIKKIRNITIFTFPCPVNNSNLKSQTNITATLFKVLTLLFTTNLKCISGVNRQNALNTFMIYRIHRADKGSVLSHTWWVHKIKMYQIINTKLLQLQYNWS